MNIFVVMPVFNRSEFTVGLLRQIQQQTRQPDKIIIIDDGSTDDTPAVVPPFHGRGLNLDYVRLTENRGVNHAWNVGLSRSGDADVVSILNNDLLINDRFFECIEIAFSLPEVGYVIPNTLPTKEEYMNSPIRPLLGTIVDARHREGWAFSIRYDVFLRGGRVPDTLKTFYGDDWFWMQARRFGYRCVKMLHNPIFHYVSQSLYQNNRHEDYPADIEAWQKVMVQHG